MLFKRLSKIIGFSSVVFLAACISDSARWVKTPPQPTLAETLDLAIDANFKDSQPGIAIMIFRNGKVMYQQYKGLADVKRKLPIQSDTGFRLASVSKIFTALAILQLYEAGKLSLSDSITTYLPDVPPEWKKITIYHLLVHCSGIPDFLNDEWFIPSMLDNHYVRHEYIHKRELEFEPGTSCEYSNTGYVLLAEIVSSVSGLGFDQYMEKNIFSPLSMSDSFIYDGDIGVNSLGALNLGKTLEIGGRESTFTGSSSQVSSIDDMKNFSMGLFEGKIISQEKLKLMLTPHPLYNGDDYGYGIHITNNGITSYHLGGHDGFSTCFFVHWPSKTSVIILKNNGGHASTFFLLDLMDPFMRQGNRQVEK